MSDRTARHSRREPFIQELLQCLAVDHVDLFLTEIIDQVIIDALGRRHERGTLPLPLSPTEKLFSDVRLERPRSNDERSSQSILIFENLSQLGLSIALGYFRATPSGVN